jgi:hypothetical protein
MEQIWNMLNFYWKAFYMIHQNNILYQTLLLKEHLSNHDFYYSYNHLFSGNNAYKLKMNYYDNI